MGAFQIVALRHCEGEARSKPEMTINRLLRRKRLAMTGTIEKRQFELHPIEFVTLLFFYTFANKKTIKLNRLVFLILFACFSISLEAERVRIFTPDDGLSNSHITNIFQDSQGYIWIATENGLNKFNGYSFTAYSEQPDDSTSLKGNYVYSVFEDSHGNFWVGTTRGLFRYDRNTDSFHPFLIQSNNPFYLDRAIWMLEDRRGNIWVSNPGDGIICLDALTLKPTFFNRLNSNLQDINISCAYEDSAGNLWLGTDGNGLYVFNTNTGTINKYVADPSMPGSLNNGHIYSICSNAKGEVLVGTLGGGVNRFDPLTHTFKPMMQENSQIANQVFDLCLDRSGNLWVGTDGAGIVRYDANGNKLPNLNILPPDVDLKNSKVHQIYEDQQGNIWIVVYQKGVLFIPSDMGVFKNYGYDPFNPAYSIGTACVISVLEDSRGDVWIGTDGDGLYRINSTDQHIVHFSIQTYPAFPSNVITTLYEDSNKDIWIGTFIAGMFRYNRKSGQFDSRYQTSDSPNSLGHNHVTKFVEDGAGNIWIGMNGGGINRFDPKRKEFKQYRSTGILNHENQLASNWVYDLLIDDRGAIWIATSNGVNVFDPKTEVFTNLSSREPSLNTNLVYCLNRDFQGNIWLGSFFGLYCVQPESGMISHYTTQNGLPDNMITGIEEDETHSLWLSTGKGLCRYNRQTGDIMNFYVEDGIQSNEFRRGCFCKGKNNRMYFGGIKGLTTFLPSRLYIKNTLLRLAFVDLLINNKPVPTGKSRILTKTPDASESVRLSFDQRNFTLTFAALEYKTPQRVTYFTKMEKFDTEWRSINSARSVTYTNLNPGKYVFKVKATLDGENFLQREIQVIIDPPFWLTIWAKIFYTLFILTIAYMIYKYLSNRMEQKQILREQEQQKELSEAKMQFFTDISHEIRTPLSLIIAPLEKLIEKSTDLKNQTVYKIIYRNAIRILRLINQLMDLRAVEKGKLKLKLEKTSLEEFVNQIMESFEDLAKTKHLRFELIHENGIPPVYIDRDFLDKIIFNLLSNAFKFTPSGGNITVFLGIKQATIEIRVEDTGIGIEKEAQAFIFDRFFQVRDRKSDAKSGTGIGLHLSKMLVELHHGSIRVESEPNKGSKFFIELPLDEKQFSPECFEPVNSSESASQARPTFLDYESSLSDENNMVLDKTTGSLHTLLIIEDDTEILNYIRMELSKKYTIYTANNGKDGLNRAFAYLPDVIISDIVMPERDGLTLCRILKTNEKTCHIPIILLTAKTSMEQQIEGLEMGADAYISKPFNLKYLETQIEKLIQVRMVLKQKFTEAPGDKNINTKQLSSDEKLLHKFNEKLKEQIGNPDLNVESISRELGISRVHLNRRLKTIIHESPGNYIREYRLKQAAGMLASKKLTVAEVAYATGFTSHAYFSNIFKERYGMTPSEYMELNAGN